MWEELHVFGDGVSPWDWVKRKKSLEWGRMGWVYQISLGASLETDGGWAVP